MAELSVRIRAEIKDLQKKLKKAESDLKNLGSVGVQQGKNLEQGANIGAKGVDNLNKSVKGTVPTMTSFSQVIQDAPFGIRGVANNITQLTSQFGSLQKNAGGTVGALKALGSSLVGPAGILLAVSAVTSILVSYGDKLFKSASGTKALAEATKEYVGEAKAEISTLESLLGIATDEAQSKVVRQKAIDELNDQYGDYLGNLDLETVKTDEVRKAVELLSLAILQKAKIQGAEAQIQKISAESSEKIVESTLDRKEALEALSTVVNRAIENNAELQKVVGDNASERDKIKALIDLQNRYGSIGSETNNFITALKRVNEGTAEIKNLEKEANEAIKPIVELKNEFKEGLFRLEGEGEKFKVEAVEIEASLSDIEKEAQKVQDKLKQFQIRIENELFKSDLKEAEEEVDQFFTDVEQIYSDSGARLADALKKSTENALDQVEIEAVFKEITLEKNEIEKLQKEIKAIFNKNDIKFDLELKGLNVDQLERIKEQMRSASEGAEIFSNSIQASFRAMTSQIVQSLDTGSAVLDAFIATMIGGITELLGQLLANLATEAIIGSAKSAIAGTIAQAQGVQIATSAAAALGPLGIGALPGLLASTQAIIAGALAKSQIPAFALGGFSGDNQLAYLNRNELILRPQEQAALYNALRGFSMNPITSSGVRDNGDNELVGEVILRGNNQIVQFRRAEKRMGRRFNS